MNTVFPLMPWKNYTQKKKDKKIHIFLHIYKKPPSLTTREVEQPGAGSGTGFVPDQQFLRASHPVGSRRARLSLGERAGQSLS